jgi:hypothetical protein
LFSDKVGWKHKHLGLLPIVKVNQDVAIRTVAVLHTHNGTGLLTTKKAVAHKGILTKDANFARLEEVSFHD